MNRIPLMDKLRKEYHKRIAYAQDLLVIQLYTTIPNIVLHGGTVIWRCYGGNRFSEDMDAIIPNKFQFIEKMDIFKKQLNKLGFEIPEFRLKEKSLYARLVYSRAEVRLEAIFRDINRFVSKPYEMVDGTYIYINVLPTEDMIIEKVRAYLARRKGSI